MENVSKHDVVVANDNGHVLRFQEKPKVVETASNRVNTGIYIFEPEIFNHIPAGVEYDIGGQLLPSLIAVGAQVYPIALPFQWVDIGSVADFWQATRLVFSGEAYGYRLPGTELMPGVRVGLGIRANWNHIKISGPVYVGSGTATGDSALIEGPALIGVNCIIEDNAQGRRASLTTTAVSAASPVWRNLSCFPEKSLAPKAASLISKKPTLAGFSMTPERGKLTASCTRHNRC